jgi:hypothetical protein
VLLGGAIDVTDSKRRGVVRGDGNIHYAMACGCKEELRRYVRWNKNSEVGGKVYGPIPNGLPLCYKRGEDGWIHRVNKSFL